LILLAKVRNEDTTNTEILIEQLVYEFYVMTEEEIKIVEKN